MSVEKSFLDQLAALGWTVIAAVLSLRVRLAGVVGLSAARRGAPALRLGAFGVGPSAACRGAAGGAGFAWDSGFGMRDTGYGIWGAVLSLRGGSAGAAVLSAARR